MMKRCFITTAFFLNVVLISAQQSATMPEIPSRFLDRVSSHVTTISDKLNRSSDRAVKKLLAKERKIKARLSKKDSTKAKEVFGDSEQKYQDLALRTNDSVINKQYLPELDTLSTSLKFISENQGLVSIKSGGQEKIGRALRGVNGLEHELDRAKEVKEFLAERKQYLAAQLKDMGFASELKKINKQCFYFSEQLHEYKTMLKDHKKMERRVLTLLSKTQFFQDFMRKNSFLASLFRLPGDPDDPINLASIAGLQTRAQVGSLIQQQIASGGPNAQQQFSQNMQEAQSSLKKIQQKATDAGSYGSGEMPEGFRPNTEKVKSFLQRLEYGTNLQTQKASNFFPVTSDLALSAGYKINDRSIIGLGVSYKIGWGKSWKDINVTNQGLGLRGFIDWKIKGSFWLSGGYEQNFKTAFRDIAQLKDQSAWQQSGLIGLSKIVSLKTKMFKKTKVQLLWDFLSNEHIPVTQPIVFRIGYNF